MEIVDRIKLDKRHHNIEILYRSEINQPAFSGWSMGFVDVEEIFKEGDKDFIKLFKEPFRDDKKMTEAQIGKVNMIIDKFKNGAWRTYVK